MFRCELCGRLADKHHIVHRSDGGVDFPLNIIYLCSEHHRGKDGPHKNRSIDLQYKIQLKQKLEIVLKDDFYKIEKLIELLQINRGMMKRILKELKLYKEGYRTKDVIYRLMGNEELNQYMMEEYYEFIANF
ncbi:MAG: HNH endonuclease [Solirubrobacterales bacterium]